MNAKQFLTIVQQGDQLNKDQVNKLYKLHQNFPYFQIPNVLLAKYESKKTSGKPSDFLAWAAINSPDRAWLKKLIEEPDSISKLSFQAFMPRSSEPVLPNNETIQTVEDSGENELIPKPTPEQSPSQRAGVLKKLDEELKGNTASSNDKPEKPKRKRGGSDDLIETIKKKEKKEILDIKKKEQIDLIKSFSKKDIKLATIKEIENFQKQSDLSEESTKLNPSLLSESYARLLAKQGKNKKAKEIYQKLMVKFPNKSTYFADLIKELEN
ncbi:hypothetical protein ACFSKL_21485 [Belliella marina]|uniref:Tetratricopeptide repeat protein n=1 Tax=Belliella marina TaxID=1644146 RepID=A0ABW4VRU1_9BACT